MDRRRFLQRGIAGGAVALGAGGLLFVRRAQARSAMVSRMLDDALPPLSSNSLGELKTLPVRAREEMRRYFDGKCLNVAGFVGHICSNEFLERVGRCRTQEERQICFVLAFCHRVATEDEILNRVQTIAAEVGSELDSGWADYCTELSGRWATRLQGYGSPLAMDELSNRLEGMIRTEITQAARQAGSLDRRPAVGETIDKIGKSALLLLPLVRFGQTGLAVGIPVFFFLAARHVWNYVAGRLNDHRGDYKAAISRRLALLGNRVGSEFEREVRLRLTDLHTWQERSIRSTAERLAKERVGLF
jgi:hypothetical protein